MSHPQAPFSIADSLARAEARVPELLRALGDDARVDVAGLPLGALSYALSRASQAREQPMVVLVPDAEQARRVAADLRFFLADGDAPDAASAVLHYPMGDTTPFLEVAPDRAAMMDRLSVLFHLARGLPWRFCVLPCAAALRRVPPGSAVVRRSQVIREADEIDRDELARTLAEGGYLRVPVVEDPGTFAVRGALVDVFPAHARLPVRIELDDDLVVSLKRFDPDDQRTGATVPETWVHPVRETLLGAEELGLARERISDLCDEVNLPSIRRRQLVEDVASGRMFLGIEGLLPAFYPRLETLFDYLPDGTRAVMVDPTACIASIQDALQHAENDHAAKREEQRPLFDLEAYYLDEAQLAEELRAHPAVVAHKLAVGGEADEAERSPLAAWEQVDPERALRLGAEDQSALLAELKSQRASKDKHAPLAPLQRRIQAWLDEGMHVVLTARTHTQAERLGALLRSYGIPLAGKPQTFDPAMLERPPADAAHVVVGDLADGFVLGSQGQVFVTEEEVFGARGHRRPPVRKSKDTTRAFVEDLRELQVGDFVVHVDHGVGRYLGLQRKQVPLSRYEQMQGVKPIAVEVLVVEYAAGDKLYLPVTRLNQIEKLAGKEGSKPKLDKLGGQTFARTKSKVRKAVRQLADELLSIYAARAARARDPLPARDRLYAEFEAGFPFEETPDQDRAITEVMSDLDAPQPMDRLVCGDVGFGKTEVALRAAFRVAMSGRQVAILCPTTVLAQQHFLTFQDRMRDYPLRVEVLSRFVPRKEQSAIIKALKEGRCDVIVGTHRLLSKDVHFRNLGLLVVDEEQRFGVTHKERIKKLRTEVDVLTLSATPIPRTLHMAIGGMRSLSLITTPPVDRRAIRTIVTRWDDRVIREALQRELVRGGQVFFVYNRIDGLYERAARLQELLPEARIAVAHGKLGEATLERTMTDFVEGRYDVLCSTAIIENGLDIPRANTILIDRADIFGLSQLYQLRGRVGRARERAYCYLIAPPPSAMTDEARTRIEALERFSGLGAGFQVASLDMELRGAGDLLGAEQSGNVAAVGMEMYVQMLEEAVAELRGQPVHHDVDPEITAEQGAYLPEEYIDDVGVRLSLYKRFASAEDEQTVADLGAEMEDRFGPPPPEALGFVRTMSLKPALRELRVMGCEASRQRVTLHLRDDTPLDSTRITAKVAQEPGWKLTPDMKLTLRFPDEEETDAVERVQQALRVLEPLRKDAQHPDA